MSRWLRARIGYANVVGTLALFLALGGTSYAALAITGRDVVDGSLTGRDVKNQSLTTSDVRDGSLRAGDFATGQLPAGPQGPEGPRGPEGPPNRNADKLDDLDSTDFLKATAKAADADKVDGVDASDLAESNVLFATAGAHDFTVPAQVKGVIAELRGAGGGGSFYNTCGSAGQGGLVRAHLAVDAGRTLTINVGRGGFGGNGGNQNGQVGGASSLASAGTTLMTAAGGAGGTCSAGGSGGDATVSAPAIGLEKRKGADGTVSGSNSVQVPGGGTPGFFGSGDDSGASPTGFQGSGGYVLLHLLR